MSDSAGSGSFEASFVILTKLAFERVSMAECIMGSQTSSMFGITNIFCGKKNTLAQEENKEPKKQNLELVLNHQEYLTLTMDYIQPYGIP